MTEDLVNLECPFFLVALPQLKDDHFMHAVVLVTSHNKEGAFGLILNKPLIDEQNAQAVMRAEVRDIAGQTVLQFNEDLFQGGPVQDDSIFALHSVSELGAQESKVGSDLFISSDPTVFQKLLEKKEETKRRFFLGCSSWESGQLDAEIRSGSWLPIAFNKNFLFETYDEKNSQWKELLWKNVLRAGGVDPLTIMAQGPGSGGDFGFN